MVIEVPEVSDVEMAFPCNAEKLLPKWEQLTDEEKRGEGPYCNAVEMLFFKGGRLDSFFKAKPGIDLKKCTRFVAATLGDYGPKHEHKIGGIAHMLRQWCDVIVKKPGHKGKPR